MPSDNRLVLASPEVRRFFSQYRIAVGSTGNLGLSIGVTAAALGFKATVHMSAEAKEWKKERLRSRGVEVIEHAGDFGEAVAAGRIQAKADSRTYFIDDEYSEKLFLGYSVAALNLSNQLASLRIEVDEKHPLLVYVPCGVGGAPGGITFGLRHVFGDNVHCFFAEPVASPCMLIRLANSNNHLLSVRDLGLDNETEADGLAVARASEFVAPRIKTLVSGIFTVTDNQLFSDLYVLEKTLGLRIEPSAAAGIRGPNWLLGSKEGHRYTKLRGLAEHMDDSTHVVWTTGGLFMPDEIYGHYRERGRVVHSSGVAGPGHSDLGMFELR